MDVHEAFHLDNLSLPVPQRINLLLLLGCWFWYLIIKLYIKNDIDIVKLIALDKSASKEEDGDNTFNTNNNANNLSTLKLSKIVYNFNVKLTKIILPMHIITCTFWFFRQNYADVLFSQPIDSPDSRNDPFFLFAMAQRICEIIIKTSKIYPLLQALFIVYYILRNCSIIRYCCSRLIFIESRPRNLRTTYILISDTLTSYAKPLIDFTIYNSILITGEIKLRHLDLLVACIPIFIRIFQCIREFINSNGMDKNHLYNSMKYASGLPVLFCMWISRAYPEYHETYQINVFHKVFMLINSTFSFYWDIRKDWSITSLYNIRSSSVANTKADPKANKRVNFPVKYYYYTIFYDLIIRYWWCWIFFGQILGFELTDSMIFDGETQYLEIARRALWAIFRLESDHISSMTSIK
ncbi:hypothetical protein TPHA_0J03020 [Tetrapisispora phaffii CBS 4417]|uniref:EXS domain-containing protein n=1 Tax=Tetrapisispora phaffii (strain ATCC 24235 / CBS 4417 / NBRC 1672 / NRRL Y-8282 / UCD 70-5) TaxID=1071381 RepID=G8BY71_TETPH|nr:hypothetical protein TPHA_0J03020 [Tetrapisispora phaffii CBS 4417]CCE65122.1 hypothetical protein TPHA_0J03020 [Tetrapisispora phaffii CBS 4417]